MSALGSRLRTRFAAAASEPFSHGPRPLADTMEHRGDPGLFGPDSVTWQVMGRAATFIGGIRGLLIQASHPEVVAGVDDHSRYRDDPLGRLTRTALYVTTTAYGAMPEVEEVVAMVRGRHRPVIGRSHRDIPYAADDPQLAAWVHNALTDSFLAAHQRYSGNPLSAAAADRFVAEQTRVGALLDADPMPSTAADLARWIAEHPAVAGSPGQRAATAFLASPPLAASQRAGYRVLHRAAVATLPDRIADALDVRATPLDPVVGGAAGWTLRTMLGDSPAWQAALARVGAPVPPSAAFHDRDDRSA